MAESRNPIEIYHEKIDSECHCAPWKGRCSTAAAQTGQLILLHKVVHSSPLACPLTLSLFADEAICRVALTFSVVSCCISCQSGHFRRCVVGWARHPMRHIRRNKGEDKEKEMNGSGEFSGEDNGISSTNLNWSVNKTAIAVMWHTHGGWMGKEGGKRKTPIS